MRSGVTLGEVSSLSYCGKGNIKSDHWKSRIASQVSRRRGLYDGLQGGEYNHSHSYPHNLGKYNCLFPTHHLRRLGIQETGIPSLFAGFYRPSNSGVTRPCRVLDWLCPPQSIWRFALVMVACLWVYLSMMPKSWLAFLVGKVCQLKSAYPYGWLRFLLSHLAAWQDCQSYFLKLNQVVYPYLILPQSGIGCKP